MTDKEIAREWMKAAIEESQESFTPFEYEDAYHLADTFCQCLGWPKSEWIFELAKEYIPND